MRGGEACCVILILESLSEKIFSKSFGPIGLGLSEKELLRMPF